jgi:AraC-like DNA-binding protein
MRVIASEKSKFWTAPDVGNLELFRASFLHHTFSRHYHDTYVIFVQESGAEEFFCRGASRLAPVGSIGTINPGEAHTGRAFGGMPWVYRALYPEIGLVQEVAAQGGMKNGSLPYFPVPVVFDSSLAQQLSQMHCVLEASAETLTRQTVFLETFTRLITRYATNAPASKPAGAEPHAVQLVRAYIETHYRENLSVTELAQIVNLNPFYLIRAFRKAVGLPPHEYLIQVRLRRAMKDIAAGLPLAEVALETGFVDQSHLTHRFKRVVGITPKQFAQGVSSSKRISRNHRL